MVSKLCLSLSLTQGNVTFDSTGNRVGNSVRIAQYVRGKSGTSLPLDGRVLINEVS